MDHFYIIIGLFLFSISVGVFLPLLIVVFGQKDELRRVAVIVLALSMIGACAGLAGGMSRVGAVGTIIPAFLGLLGGLSIYLFGIDNSRGLIASIGAVALSLSLITSYTVASQFRNTGDDHREIRSICASAYKDWQLLSNETAFNRFRARLGTLCDASMNWQISD